MIRSLLYLFWKCQKIIQAWWFHAPFNSLILFYFCCKLAHKVVSWEGKRAARSRTSSTKSVRSFHFSKTLSFAAHLTTPHAVILVSKNGILTLENTTRLLTREIIMIPAEENVWNSLGINGIQLSSLLYCPHKNWKRMACKTCKEQVALALLIWWPSYNNETSACKILSNLRTE